MSDASLAALLESAPEGAVLFEGQVTTRSQLTQMADNVATQLSTAGVAPGGVVAVQLPNGPDVVATLFGVWRAGAAYTPLNPRATVTEVEAQLAAVDAAAHISDEGTRARRGGRNVGKGVALVQFTSGTTGPPKAVPLHHDTVLDMLDRVVGSIRKPRSSDPPAEPAKPPMPNLVPLSLSLWAGIYQVLFAFRVGAPVVLMERFNTTDFARLVSEYEIKSTVLPPAALAMLTDDESIDDLKPLRIVRSITASLSPVQARRFHERFGVIVLNSYGQTELGGEIVGWSVADVRGFGTAKLGSVGRVHEGVDLRVDDLTGELLARTPSTSSGLIPEGLDERLLDGGWFRTGDLGRIDDDGFVWIEGRVSDMINRGGNKVFPAQVEDVLLQHPSVRDAAVVGAPDTRLGEVPVAFIVPVDGTGLDAQGLEAWCRQHLTPYRVPVRYHTIESLPRNEIGKVLRTELREPNE